MNVLFQVFFGRWSISLHGLSSFRTRLSSTIAVVVTATEPRLFIVDGLRPYRREYGRSFSLASRHRVSSCSSVLPPAIRVCD